MDGREKLSGAQNRRRKLTKLTTECTETKMRRSRSNWISNTASGGHGNTTVSAR